MEKIQKIDFHISKLETMKEYPSLSYLGNIDLLNKPLISLVGSRRPNSYTKTQILNLVSKLTSVGVVIVSGAAMGCDALAHKSAGVQNTIAVLPNGFDYKYPAVNKNLITDIQKKGLCISQFENDFKARSWSFVLRNELVVALGEVLIVGQADIGSGSMRSIEYALKQNKEIYVFPQRIGDSEGTNKLLKEGLAKAIYDIDEFVAKFGEIKKETKDEFLEYCKSGEITYDEALEKFESKVFEYELLGKIKILDGRIKVN